MSLSTLQSVPSAKTAFIYALHRSPSLLFQGQTLSPCPPSLPPCSDGEWLDTFITVLDPQVGLTQPVAGLIGECRGGIQVAPRGRVGSCHCNA